MKLAAFGLAMTILSAFAADVKFEHSPKLQLAVDQSIEAAAISFSNKKLNLEQMAVTVVDLRDPARLRFAAHRGQERIYPASVIKMFYLEAAHRWMEEGRLRDTPELRRAMRDMIVDSYNEATHYVLDLLTGTTSGPELPDAEMKEWAHKRNAVNRYFAGRGYPEINANQKPWCEGPYGRDRIFVGETYTNRNMLTTDATARLLAEIALGQAVSKKRSEEMLELMKRDPFAESGDPDGQAHGFTGPAVPPGAELWSKAGWTSKTRHDAALIEMPNGARVVLVIFTVDHANERGIIPMVARPILKQFEP